MRDLHYLHILVSLLLLSIACQAQDSKPQADKTGQEKRQGNHLIHESSPYLLQHAYNPVDWYPWGEEALQKAQSENKLLIISIGYAACHWCHVMEHESFADPEVARIMNEHFVSIKVDREERPDIDQIYMTACQILTGRGGWPLNCIALPDGRPVYAGTYFRKEHWQKLLTDLQDGYAQTPENFEARADKITQGISNAELIDYNPNRSEFSLADLEALYIPWKLQFDTTRGGNNRAPKFPMPNNWQFLLRYFHMSGDSSALKQVVQTLNHMAWGGIYDHIGGGFARYSVDGFWHVPHFEKMLYDNAQLVSLYAQAYQITGRPLYKKVVYQILDFIAREMTSPIGGFYSSLDADSDGEEGKFYVWTRAEIEQILGSEAPMFCDAYGVLKEGNWEHGKNILHRIESDMELAKIYKTSVPKVQETLHQAKQTLLQERAKRIRPGLDDKVLTSWNALMIQGYVDAYRIFGEKEFLQIALKNAQFLVDKQMDKDHRLRRNYKDGVSSINGFLDDYSFTIEAFIALYQATFEEQWLLHAKDLMDYAITHFYDPSTKMFFYTSDLDPALIKRTMEATDNVIPASNSSLAKGLFFLGQYFYNEDYINRSRQMLQNISPYIKRGTYYSNWAALMTYFIEEPYEVAIVGENADQVRAAFDKHYLPNVLMLGGKNGGNLTLLKNKLIEGQTTIYVCQNKTCQLPVTEVEAALKQIK